MKTFIRQLKFNERGLIPAIIQDYKTEKVLTLCYMTQAALEKTLEENKIYVFRRSKNKLMMKGESSGHVQIVKELFIDCEDNSLLFKVEQKTGACHAGYFTCYYRRVKKDGAARIIEKRVFDPKKVYPVRDRKGTNGEGKISNGVY
ncbi:MAG: phosphoribosyl-AMP cyclohydrolase [Candidatus Omnitrophota bacterium]|nr:phosphoribosyl-AMP cyclohydrolase [Candidatus Omnitrophota bacterium]